MGRPSEYTPERGVDFCTRIASGRSMRSVCKDEDMPESATIFRWIAAYPDFQRQYAHACDERAELMAEETLEIADEASQDWINTPDGPRLNTEHVQRSRLRVDTRKWYLSKVMPRKYGDKVDMNHGVQADNPIVGLLGAIGSRSAVPVASKPEDDEE